MPDIIRSVLDVGTNSVKIIAAQLKDDGLHTLLDIERITRLGEGAMSNNTLQPSAIERTINEIVNLTDEVKLFSPASIDVIGTSILRRSHNRKDFAKLLFEKTGLNLRLLSRFEEAVAAFLAIRSEFPSGELVTLDVGGGSAEIAYGTNEHPAGTHSFRLGGRELFAKFPLSDPPQKTEFNQVIEYIRKIATNIPQNNDNNRLVLVGGSATALAGYARALMGAPGGLVANELYMSTLDRLIELLSECTLEERKNLPGSNPDRADVMVHAAISVRELMKIMNFDSADISLRSISHGVLESQRLDVSLDNEETIITLPGSDFPPFNKKNRSGEVLFILRRPDGKIWLQTKDGYQEGVFRIPGGGIDYEEAPGDALAREVDEETGYLNYRAFKAGIIRYQDTRGWKIPFVTHVYFLDVPDDEPVNSDPNEAISGWLAADPEECLRWAKILDSLDGEFEAWGKFRAAALHFAAKLSQRGTWYYQNL